MLILHRKISTIQKRSRSKSRRIVITYGSASKTYDSTPLICNEYTLSGDEIDPLDTLNIDADGTQTLVGSSETRHYGNTPPTITGTSGINYEIEEVHGTVTVTDGTAEGEEPVDDDLVVLVSAEDGPYSLGETVYYTICATNIYDESKTITLTEIEGVSILQNTLQNLDPGESREVEAIAWHVITEADILRGSFTNTVTARLTNNFIKTAQCTVVTEEAVSSLSIDIVETSSPANEESYTVGETVQYSIEVTNNGNLTITGINVTSELTNEFWSAASIRPQQTLTFTPSPIEVDGDLIISSLGELPYNATVTGYSPDPDNPEVSETGECTSPLEEPNPHLTVTLEETSSPTSNDGYELDETVQWNLIVENVGNIAMSGNAICEMSDYSPYTFTNLAPEASITYSFSYTVSIDDVENGEIYCTATAEATNLDEEIEEYLQIDDGESTVYVAPYEIDPENAVEIEIETSDEPANTETYALGEIIPYEVTITNTTSLTLSNVVVASDLTGDEWTLESLAPGESQTYETSYIVTEADILAGQVICEFIANGETPDIDNPEFASSVQFISDTDSPNPSLSVTLVETTTPANNISYALGEEIRYKAIITNNGNLTITDIETANEITEDWNTIDSLAPGKSEEFTRQYVVRESDILIGLVTVEETATGTSSDPDNSSIEHSGICENAVDEPESHLTLSIVESSSPANNTAYAVGETINYVIDGTNDGNLTISNLVVTAYFNGSFVGSWTIDYLNPGYTIARRNYYYSPLLEEHAVIPEDIVAGEAVMSVNATGTMPNNYTLQVQEAECSSVLEDAS